jgi:geranylgeranyl reductase family protein
MPEAPTPEPFDVVVVGAGPAGTAGAITAVAHGLRAVCVDKATFPRDKTCGDGLTTNALRLLEHLGLRSSRLDALGAATVTDTILVSPSGRRVDLPLPLAGRHAVVVPRVDLDTALVELARSRGVEVREGRGVVDVVPNGQHVMVKLADGSELRAAYVIAADGHWSPTRRALHPDTEHDLGEWHAARQYFSNVADARLWVVFDRELLPGYAWVFPLPGARANVGYGVLRDDARHGRDLKELWPRVLNLPVMREILGSSATPEGTVRAWPIPARYDRERLADGRVLFAGDAAAVVDPMTGEGIAQAIESGILAARAVAESFPNAGDVADRYRAAVHRALGRDLWFAGALQSVLRRPLGARAAIRAAGLTDWTRRNFARWMWEDYPRALIITPDRWHRGALSAAGAYSVPS